MSLALNPDVRPPPAALIDRFRDPMVRVARVWTTLARYYPVVITSWYRPEAVNASTGGKTYSQHLVGCAMDGKSPGMSRAQLLPLVQRVAAQLGGVTVPSAASETSGSSVHVQGLPVGYVQRLVTANPGLIAQAESFVGPPQRIA